MTNALSLVLEELLLEFQIRITAIESAVCLLPKIYDRDPAPAITQFALRLGKELGEVENEILFRMDGKPS